MQRVALFLLVALLAVNTTGVLDVVLSERCELFETSSTPEEDCSSTCVRCHCGRAFDLELASAFSEVWTTTPAFAPLPAALPLPRPRDILHVPRPSAS